MILWVEKRLENVYAANMANEANTVNIAKRYHHGDVRAAVLVRGLARLEEADAAALSLRELARDVGVSAPALYRHFRDRDALLDALAGEGAAQLAARQRAASERAGGGEAGFTECGREYVRFALSAPHLFKLMFARLPPPAQGTNSMGAAVSFLHDSIAGWLPPGATDERRKVAAMYFWSLVHGLALLMLDGQLPADPLLVDRVIGREGFAAAFPPHQV